MKLYLAGNHTIKNTMAIQSIGGGHRILESYYYIKNNPWFPQILPLLDDFLLDSGAFTFMQGSHDGPIDWDEYVAGYADFINQYDIELFFELDIDSIVGIAEVERLRNLLEKLTGKKPIPVWHQSRGIDYFKRMVAEFKYVSVGGIVTKELPTSQYEKLFPWFIQTAHNAGVRIHGLGYSGMAGLHKYHFDSVDSSAWLYGNRGGYLNIFDDNTGYFRKVEAPEGTRLVSKDAALFNYRQWQKFQLYAEKYL